MSRWPSSVGVDLPGEKPFKTELLQIPGRTFRKEGLGKNVTDKFLAGLPGVQKRVRWFDYLGRWILHRHAEVCQNRCLNFSDRRVMRFKHR